MTTEMGGSLADRVRKRLDTLGINAFEAVENANRVFDGKQKLSRNYVYGFVVGKKDRPRSNKGFVQLAVALECSVEYLTGASATPGLPPIATQPSNTNGAAQFGGLVEPSVWQAGSGSPLEMPRSRLADPDFPLGAQIVFAYRGAPDLPLVDPVVIGIDPEQYVLERGPIQVGKRIVLERKTKIGNGELLTQRSIRTVVDAGGPGRELKYSADKNDEGGGQSVAEDASRGIDTRVIAVVTIIYSMV